MRTSPYRVAHVYGVVTLVRNPKSARVLHVRAHIIGETTRRTACTPTLRQHYDANILVAHLLRFVSFRRGHQVKAHVG